MSEKTTKERLAEAVEFMRELSSIRPTENGQRTAIIYNKHATKGKDATAEERREFNAGWRIQIWEQDETFQPSVNMFACIASIIKTPNSVTGKMRYWRSKEAFASALAYYIDDIGSGKGSKGDFQLDELSAILPPTAIVETSPGNYQAWYFFKHPVTDAQYFHAFIRSFVSQVIAKRGGDQTVKDIVRIGRIPFGINNKQNADGTLRYPGADGRPWQVRLFAADYSRRYTLEEIADAFQVDVVSESYKPLQYDADDLKWDAFAYQLAKVMLTKMGMGEASGLEVRENQSGKCRIRCLWGHEHKNGDPTGAYIRGPMAGEAVPYLYHCAHDTCRERAKSANMGQGGMWEVFTDALVIPQIAEHLRKCNSDANVAAYEQYAFKGRVE